MIDDIIRAGMAGSAIAVVLVLLRVAFHDFWDEDD